MYLVSDKYKYVLQTWEKSGCTTMRNLFLRLHYDELTDKEKRFVVEDVATITTPNGACDSNDFEHIHREGFPHYLPDAKREGYFTFGVVRNSYERVVSMYFNRWLNIDPMGPYWKTMGLPRPEPWDKYGRVKSFSFNEFVTYLCVGITKMMLYEQRVMPAWATIIDKVAIETIKDQLTVDEHGKTTLSPNGDHHMRSQWDSDLLRNYVTRKSNNTIDRYIHLNKLGDELPKLYEEKIGISADTIKDILSDRKMTLKKGNFENEGKLDDYDFLMDPKGYNILKNGIPSAKNMITVSNASLIRKWYAEEIEFHRFDYKHLL